MVARMTITALYSAIKECRLQPVEDSIEQFGIPKGNKKTTDYLLLQTAVEKNHKNIAKLLINAGCRVNPNDNEKDNGWTPLAWAIIRGNFETAMQLLNKKATCEAGNKSGLTVLHLAVRKKSLSTDMLRLLMCHMSPNDVDNKGQTVLQTFFQVVCNQVNPSQVELTNNAAILELLLTKGASLNFQNDPHGYTPLHYAVKSTQVALINKIIREINNVNVRSSCNDTPLHVLLADKNSYKKGALDILRILVRNGADVNASNTHCETLLHVILSRCYGNENQIFEVVQYLVGQGANINVQNHRRESACHLAARKKCFRILHLFLQQECHINLKDYENNTVLHRLLQNSKGFKTNDAFIEIVNQMLELEPELGTRNAEDKTPFDLIMQNMQSRLLARFLTENFDINAVDDKGNTALHNFLNDLIDNKSKIGNDHTEMVEALASNGANVDLANSSNKTPIQLVFDLEKDDKSNIINRRIDILKMLFQILNYSNNLDSNIVRGKPILHIMSSLKKPYDEEEHRKAAEIVNRVLENGATVDLQDNSEMTALGMAATNQQHLVVEALLNHNANPNAYIPTSQATILECLLRQKVHLNVDVEIAGLLLQHGAEIDQSPSSEFSILNYVTLPDKLDMCSKLIVHSKDVNIVDEHQNTALHNLLRAQSDIDEVRESKVCKVVTELVLKGDLIESNNDEGLTPLHLAVKHKLYEVTKYLLESNANPDARDNAGNIPLHFLGAFKYKNDLEFVTKMVKMFTRQYGCDVNTNNNNGTTPLAAAIQFGCRNTAQALIKRYKADVNSCTNDDLTTPLHLAIEYDVSVTAEQLIKHAADVNARKIDGTTALHIAVLRETTRLVDILLKNGADPNMKDNDGRTPLFLACSNNRYEMTKRLLKNGADVNIMDDADILPVEVSNGVVRTEVADHIHKLIAANMYVDPSNFLMHRGYQLLDDKLKEEVKKLKEVNINNQITLADVLQMKESKLTSFKNNEDFQKLINADNFEEQFPQYANLLKACYIKGLIRSDFLAQAKIIFRELIEMPLPDVCCDLIFSYLDNGCLENMIIAGRLKNKSQKRRRWEDDDDYDNHEDSAPPTKRVRRLSM